MAGGASGAYQLARATSGATGAAGVASGIAGAVQATGSAIAQNASNKATSGIRQSFAEGQQAAFSSTGGTQSGVAQSSGSHSSSSAAGNSTSGNAPDWAQKLRQDQHLREGISIAAHTIRDGDRPASGENPKFQSED